MLEKTDKKGIALTQLVLWTIILISFFLIAFSVERIISKSGSLESEIICRDSLILKAKTKVDLFDVKTISSPALCKTIDKKFSAVKKEEALDFFARSMERCWWIWLEGRLNEIFGIHGTIGNLIGNGDEKTKCFVCNTIVYQKGPTLTKGEILGRLGEMKSKYKNSDVLSYIQENGYIQLYETVFTSEEVYALVFASNIEESFWKGTSLSRLAGFEIPYNQNGLWLLKLNRFDKEQPCYYEPDVAGE